MNACTKLSDNFFSVSTANDAYKLIEDFETRNTVKFSCYKANKGFGGTGKNQEHNNIIDTIYTVTQFSRTHNFTVP